MIPRAIYQDIQSFDLTNDLIDLFAISYVKQAGLHFASFGVEFIHFALRYRRHGHKATVISKR